MSKPDLLEVIDRIVAALPLAPERVSAALAVPLVRLPADDTPAFSAYGLDPAAPEGDWAAVDLRMPDAIIGDGSALLSVTPRAADAIDQTLIGEHFGLDFQMEVPSPRYAPGTVPAYMIYQRPWGRLAVGVSADEARRLVKFVLTTHAS